jgi:hypothetical protein
LNRMQEEITPEVMSYVIASLRATEIRPMIKCFASAKEGNSVVAAAPLLRPAAARCGALVWVLLAGLKPCPSGPCHGRVVAQCEWEFNGFIVVRGGELQAFFAHMRHRAGAEKMQGSLHYGAKARLRSR